MKISVICLSWGMTIGREKYHHRCQYAENSVRNLTYTVSINSLFSFIIIPFLKRSLIFPGVKSRPIFLLHTINSLENTQSYMYLRIYLLIRQVLKSKLRLNTQNTLWEFKSPFEPFFFSFSK